MVVLEIADHGLHGSSASHLAANDFCDAADLAANPDPGWPRVAVDAADGNTCERYRLVQSQSVNG